ncbi:hypothetical protein GCM10008955_04200 [Deinococcus malanensis]|uniref:Uncharacterized protein n=1 Tax=Deinococcus malanensis TaxID=1706855 RepID=A0ABQ2ELV7_9DEIO|nr:hypothetical protein [Deinococcus malanensis]GGK14019.1 hypothetical protein GCM10008955_04200 [Deinococcus malanensis]
MLMGRARPSGLLAIPTLQLSLRSYWDGPRALPHGVYLISSRRIKMTVTA